MNFIKYQSQLLKLKAYSYMNSIYTTEMFCMLGENTKTLLKVWKTRLVQTFFSVSPDGRFTYVLDLEIYRAFYWLK